MTWLEPKDHGIETNLIIHQFYSLMLEHTSQRKKIKSELKIQLVNIFEKKGNILQGCQFIQYSFLMIKIYKTCQCKGIALVILSILSASTSSCYLHEGSTIFCITLQKVHRPISIWWPALSTSSWIHSN